MRGGAVQAVSGDGEVSKQTRLKELKAQLEDLGNRLNALDLSPDCSDEDVKKCFKEVGRILEERETVINEIRSMLMLGDDDDMGTRGMVN